MLLLILWLCDWSIWSESVNLVWQIYWKGPWEVDWLKELLSEVDINWIFDNGTYKTTLNNSIVAISTPYDDRRYQKFKSKSRIYFKNLKDLQYNYGVIHFSDEKGRVADYLDSAQFVFRNYWHAKYRNNDKVTVFPLGYKSGLWDEPYKQVGNCSERKYVWSFAGNNEWGRDVMIAQMKRVPSYYLNEATGWGKNAKALSIEDYRGMLLDTIFVPCPAGSVFETYRVWEALECGCIPIVEKIPTDYYNNLLGDYPFLAVDSWQQAVDEVNGLLTQPNELEALRLKCQNWWQKRKIEIRTQFTSTIRKHLLEKLSQDDFKDKEKEVVLKTKTSYGNGNEI